MFSETVIVVEGATDKSVLSQIVDAEIVITNGTHVPRETLAYIKELSKTRPILLVLDPDGAGNSIKKRIEENDIVFDSVNIDKKKAVRKGKLGVAETERKYLSSLLLPLLSEKQAIIGNIDLPFLLEIYKKHGKGRVIKRISENYNINTKVSKQVINQLNQLGICQSDIGELFNEEK